MHDNDSSYSFINEFGYMGGGVGIGDFNNDGLPDIFFTGNQVTSRLYINLGNFRFKDITAEAGVGTDSWCTGVSIADVNQDGFDDIYVSVFGRDLRNRAPNLLFINQGNLRFKEQAAEYGLADLGYSTQAAFLDYDRDGDLDMYLANYLLSNRNGNVIVPPDRSGKSAANDRLYRNRGDTAGVGHPVFEDVTLAAGIREDGYGLGLSVSDFNNDGWPDIYVANDFVSNDLLWLNNKDGSFTNRIRFSFKHQSYSSMGSDAGDINNDGLTDLVTLDMLPAYNERKKIAFSFMNYERYQSERAMGYEPEFMRNMLQLNNGTRSSGDTALPFFSEIGELSGIDATDWSWSVLMADFDNDGWKDLHITNGIGRDFINADFLEFSNTVFSSSRPPEVQQRLIRDKLTSLAHVQLPNYFFKNNGNLGFVDLSDSAGINMPSMSNGAAYADFDNDGDLDLVVNNINQPAFVFVNEQRTSPEKKGNHFLKIKLQGDSLNQRGFGTQVTLYSHGKIQLLEQSPVRGYFSSVDQVLFFGLGHNDPVDSLKVIWPDGRRQVLQNVAVDHILTLQWKEAVLPAASTVKPDTALFTDITADAGLPFLHQEKIFNDFSIQRLLPQKYSQLGPFIAVGDVNKDGIKDVFIGAGSGFPGRLFTGVAHHQPHVSNLADSAKTAEDMDCIFFDADSDGDEDLLIGGGDLQYTETAGVYKPRLYINSGSGSFSPASSAIPDTIKTIAGVLRAADFDGDGDMDLFIGGRVSHRYPLAPRSFLLLNENGVFRDVTEVVCPQLSRAGMITSAVWTDFDNDGQIDLVIAGEWMPIRFFRNLHNKLQEVTEATGLTEINGMWRSLVAADVDNDGDEDLIAGNLGLNCGYRVSGEYPMELFAADLDGNGSIDPVFFYYIEKKDGSRALLPGISRNAFADQTPVIKKKFLQHHDYAQAGYREIFKGKTKEEITHLLCNETRSCYFENIGNGRFKKHSLPVEAQFAPINALLCYDFDGDGQKDLLLAGNEYQAEVVRGRYDASYGCYLRGAAAGRFSYVPARQSGFWVNGDVKDMKLITDKYSRRVLVSVNNDSMRVFSINSRK